MKKIICALLVGSTCLQACERDPELVANSPIMTTPVSAIAATTARSGGTINSTGGRPIIARGVVWDVNPNPTIALTSKTSDGAGIGSFTSNLVNLLPNKTYYVRAYLTNATVTLYGNEISFVSN